MASPACQRLRRCWWGRCTCICWILAIAAAADSSTLSVPETCLFGDCVNGEGLYRYASGDSYAGQWMRGLRDGVGVYSFRMGACSPCCRRQEHCSRARLLRMSKEIVASIAVAAVNSPPRRCHACGDVCKTRCPVRGRVPRRLAHRFRTPHFRRRRLRMVQRCASERSP
jgi:hypothetical protein